MLGRYRFLAWIFLVAAVFGVYIPALSAGFIWDDGLLLTENPLMGTPGGLREIWLGFSMPDYLPLTMTAFWLQWRLWGLDPVGYHAVNILLHTANAILFWRLLTRLKVPGAWVAALIFALHPMNVASVAWITELKNTLSLFLMLSSAHCFFSSCSRWRWTSLAAFVLGCAAMLSKGTAVVLPALLFILWVWHETISPAELRARWKSLVWRLGPLFGAAAIFSVITIYFQSRTFAHGAVSEPILMRLVRASWALGFYLWKTICPLDLAPVYPQWSIDLHSVSAYLPALAWCGVLVGLYWLPCRRPVVAGLACFGVAVLPVLGLVSRPVFFDQAPVADWWNYVSMLPVCALLGAGLARWRTRTNCGPWSVGTAVLIVTSFGVLTWQQTEIYFSMETYSRAALEKNPQAWMARNNLGLGLADCGEFEQAAEQYRMALKERPLCLEAHQNLATALVNLGQFQEAESHLNEVLRWMPDNAKALNNLGGVLFRMGTGSLDRAITAYKASIEVFPLSSEAHNNLGVALAAKAMSAEALEQYQIALKLNPGNARAWFNAGNTMAAQNRHQQAANAFVQATRLAPTMAPAAHRLAQTLLELHHPDLAEAELQRFLRATNQRADAGMWATLARAQAALSRYPEALATLQRAIEEAGRSGHPDLVESLTALRKEYQSLSTMTAP